MLNYLKIKLKSVLRRLITLSGPTRVRELIAIIFIPFDVTQTRS